MGECQFRFRTAFTMTRVADRELFMMNSIILETDSTTIASRVSRPRADTTDIVINEQVRAIQTQSPP